MTFDYFFHSHNYCFHPHQRLTTDKPSVGTGAKKKQNLDSIRESEDGPTYSLYMGVIFDGEEQLGFAASAIEAAIVTTPALPPASFITDFNREEALLCAKLSQLAYKEYAVVQKELPKHKQHLKAEMEIYDRGSDTNGFIASDDKSVYVAFRGTSSFTDLMTDIRIGSRKCMDDKSGPLGHRRFVSALNTVYDSVEAKIKLLLGKKALYVTGHSLGGALATLTTYRLSHRKLAKPIQYVYGCPPVGAKAVMCDYFKKLNSSTITILDDRISTGCILALGWYDLLKPETVKFLPEAGDDLILHHSIKMYIEQLEKLMKNK